MNYDTWKTTPPYDPEWEQIIGLADEMSIEAMRDDLKRFHWKVDFLPDEEIFQAWCEMEYSIR